MGTWLPEMCTEKNKHAWKSVHQVGYLQEWTTVHLQDQTVQKIGFYRTAQPCQIKELQSFEVSGTNKAPAQHPIPEGLKLIRRLQHRFWNDGNSRYYMAVIFIRSIGTCRMRRFLAVLRSFFHSSLIIYPFPSTLFHQLVFHHFNFVFLCIIV